MGEDRDAHSQNYRFFLQEMRAALGGMPTDSRFSRLGPTRDGDLLTAELERLATQFPKAGKSNRHG